MESFGGGFRVLNVRSLVLSSTLQYWIGNKRRVRELCLRQEVDTLEARTFAAEHGWLYREVNIEDKREARDLLVFVCQTLNVEDPQSPASVEKTRRGRRKLCVVS